jgi:hypothetical protein
MITVSLILCVNLFSKRELPQQYPLPQGDVLKSHGLVNTNRGLIVGNDNLLMQEVLFKDDSLITHPRGGFGGADRSTMPNGQSMLGWAWKTSSNMFLDDDFTIPPGEEWKIDSIRFYGFTLSTSTTRGITSSTLKIRSDIVTGTSVFGGTTTNRMANVYWSNIYRTTQDDPSANYMPIMCIVDTLGGLVLPSGTYWLIVSADGPAYSGPWMANIAIGNQCVTGNAQQNSPNGWVYIANPLTCLKGMPKVIYGQQLITGTGGPNGISGKFKFSQNYPNPFCQSTEIRYELPKEADIVLTVYNQLGQNVRTLVNQEKQAGKHKVNWNGCNEAGNRLPERLYIYRLRTANYNHSCKMNIM